MTIERKKSFQIFCERKKIFVELYQSRLLLSSVLLGKGELKMSTLLEKCETKETIEVTPFWKKIDSYMFFRLRMEEN